MVIMYMQRELSGGRAKLLKYATSGDITGDKEAVVGYLSARFPLKSDS